MTNVAKLLLAGVNYTFGKFATGVNNTGEKLPHLSPESLTPMANCHQYQRHRWKICHPVSMTQVANNGNNIRLLTP
jgi:hypothetical protein